MKPVRIAISGKMRSGKDTVANELVQRFGFVRAGFADKLKEVAKDLFGVKETDKNRALLQMLGRRMCQVDDAVWLKYVIDRIPMYQNVVIPDLRFPNEYHTLKGLGFVMVRIDIEPHVQQDRIRKTDPGMDMQLTFDESETALDEQWQWDWDIILDGAEDVSAMLEQLLGFLGVETEETYSK